MIASFGTTARGARAETAVVDRSRNSFEVHETALPAPTSVFRDPPRSAFLDPRSAMQYR